MQVISQGSGSPLVPHGFDKFGSYARYKNKPNISNKINLFVKRLPNEGTPLKSQYTSQFCDYWNCDQQSSKSKGRNVSLEKENCNLSLSDYKDFTLPDLAKQNINYGRGRGMRNLGYSKIFLNNSAIACQDWKTGSLLRTSSELQVCYLENNNSFKTEKNQSHITSNQNNQILKSPILNQKTSILSSLKLPNTKANSGILSSLRSDKNYNSTELSNLKQVENNLSIVKVNMCNANKSNASHPKNSPIISSPQLSKKRGGRICILPSYMENNKSLKASFRNVIVDPINDINYNPYLT